MENMSAKAYLSELKRIDTCIDQKIQERNALRSRLVSIGSISDRERVQASVQRDRIGKIITDLDEMEQEINREIDGFVNKKHTIINQIQGLRNETFVKLLYKKYVEYKRLELVAVEMNYTYDYVRRCHGKALRKFEQIYAEEIKEATQ